MGGVLGTVSVHVASVVFPQLSVARIVTVYWPIAPALLMVTRPVALSTVSVPVKPAGVMLCNAIEATVPLSVGPVAGLIVSAAPRLTVCEAA